MNAKEIPLKAAVKEETEQGLEALIINWAEDLLRVMGPEEEEEVLDLEYYESCVSWCKRALDAAEINLERFINASNSS